jgi:D-alanyl-D-alanine carboxypeptidase
MAALAGALLLAAPATASVATERADAALDRALDGLVARRGGPPGVVATVRRGSEITVHTAGVADGKTRRKIQVTDRMRMASTAKAFSGAVTLSLVSAGRLSLDDTIAGRLEGLPAAWGSVTLGQALHHTSGLPDFSGSEEFRRLVGADPRRHFDSRRMWAFAASEPLEFAPGTQYRYSNTDNIIAALFAEAATGRTYESLLRDRVYRPLGLTRTSLPQGYLLPRPFIHGYVVEPPAAPEDLSEVLGNSGLWASGGIVSSPLDAVRFGAGYAGSKLFSRAVQRRQMAWVAGTSEPPGPGGNSAGLAIFRYRTRCGTVYGHTGNTAGYTQFLAGTLDGRRSVSVGASQQLTQKTRASVWRVLRAAEETAVCAALAR